MFIAERNDHRAGQGSQVNHHFRLEGFLRPVHGVAQDEPSFRIGVDHLYGLAIHAGYNVAGALRLAIGHIFDQPANADNMHLGLATSERLHGSGNGAGAAHIPLHFLHAGTGFQGNPAGIERHALADQGQRCFLRPVGAVPAHRQQSRRTLGPLRNAEQSTHAQFFHFIPAQHGEFHAKILQFLTASDETFGIDSIGRLCDQFPSESHAIGYR